MKKDKIIYWVSTVLAVAMGLMSGVMYFAVPEMKEEFHKSGFPDFFSIELGIAKIVGAIVILVPMFSARVKEWAYAGYRIVYISAFIFHAVLQGPATGILPLVLLVFLIVSNIYYHKLQKAK